MKPETETKTICTAKIIEVKRGDPKGFYILTYNSAIAYNVRVSGVRTCVDIL